MLDLFGDLGGVIEIFCLIGGLVVGQLPPCACLLIAFVDKGILPRQTFSNARVGVFPRAGVAAAVGALEHLVRIRKRVNASLTEKVVSA